MPLSNRLLLVMLLAGALNACGFMPVTQTDHKYAEECGVITKAWKLDTWGASDNLSISGCSDPECLLLFMSVPAATAIISGTIIAIGNTVHWLEKQGKCDDSALNTTINGFMREKEQAGGKHIESRQQFEDLIRPAPPVTD